MAEDNEDAKALSDAITKHPAIEAYGVTGAMHQAVIQHLFFIRGHGWEKYVEKMKEKDPKDAEEQEQPQA